MVANNAGVQVVLFDGVRDLPHFNPDIEASGCPRAYGDGGRRWPRLTLSADNVSRSAAIPVVPALILGWRL